MKPAKPKTPTLPSIPAGLPDFHNRRRHVFHGDELGGAPHLHPYREDLTQFNAEDWAHLQAKLAEPPRETALSRLLRTPTQWEIKHGPEAAGQR
jgi:hypothetical protein